MRKKDSFLFIPILVLSWGAVLVNSFIIELPEWVFIAISIIMAVFFVLFMIKVKVFTQTKNILIFIAGLLLGLGTLIVQQNVSGFPEMLAIGLESAGALLVVLYLVRNITIDVRQNKGTKQ